MAYIGIDPGRGLSLILSGEKGLSALSQVIPFNYHPVSSKKIATHWPRGRCSFGMCFAADPSDPPGVVWVRYGPLELPTLKYKYVLSPEFTG